jgi:hypothetical protein
MRNSNAKKDKNSKLRLMRMIFAISGYDSGAQANISSILITDSRIRTNSILKKYGYLW